jgi:hypothetical protein
MEIFSALRFMEDRRWLNDVFFAPYRDLTPGDFEKRPIELRTLDPYKWGVGAWEFVRKKFHNATHLKEMGVLIIIPVEYAHGALTRSFLMMLHYLSEIPFYARLFELFSKEEHFSANLVSALRGDVRDAVPPLENIVYWVIMQRYLAKEDPHDPRLLLPRVSPEARHWERAVENLAKLPGAGEILSFWSGKSHLCGFLPPSQDLLSFNLIDTVFSLPQGNNFDQYTYHAREALWNRFFTRFFENGEEVLETLLVEEFSQGFIGFKIRASTSDSQES